MYGRLSNYISQGVYTVSAPFHPFGGAVDIIVVQQQDGSFKSSPWYVKFGKFQGVLKTREKIVSINVNGVDANFNMYLDHKGEAYFLKEVGGEESESLALSPSSSSDETDEKSENGRHRKSKSYGFEGADQTKLSAQIEGGSGKIMTRTNSRRSRIFGLMFGRKAMKEDSRQREDVDYEVSRVTSLERAEIAAELLEVNWSTSHLSDKSRRDELLRLSSTDQSYEEVEKQSLVNYDEVRDSLLVDDIVANSVDYSDLETAIGGSHEDMTNSSVLSIGNGKCSTGLSSPDAACARSERPDQCISPVEAGVLEENFDVIPKMSPRVSISENADLDKKENGSLSEIAMPCMENPLLSKLDGDRIEQHDTKHLPDEWLQSVSATLLNEESGNFYIYSETSASSRVEYDVSDEKGIVTSSCSCGECQGSQVDDRIPLEKMDPRPEWAAFLEELRLSNAEDSGKSPSTKTICGIEGSSFSAGIRSSVTESHCSYDIHLLTSESGEAGMLEIIRKETVTERLTNKKNSETKSVEDFENPSHVSGSSHCMYGASQLGVEDPSRVPGSHFQEVSVSRVLHCSEEAEKGVKDSSSSIRNSSLDGKEQHLEEANEMNMSHNTPRVSIDGDSQPSCTEGILAKTTKSSSPREISEEDQFLFSDINDFEASGDNCQNLGHSDSLETEYGLLVRMDSIQESLVSNDENCESDVDLSSDKHVQECFLPFEAAIEDSSSTTTPMSIPRSRKSDVGEGERMIESLPSFRSHIENLEMSDRFQSLSHSLDSHSENFKWGLVGTDVTSSFEPDTAQKITGEELTLYDIRTLEELKNISTDSIVEISLCKHLLFEGMGSDAASEAFDAEKLDLEKFLSQGPGIVKNDKLIVRIGSHYFPWDAAAPIILGMLTFGHDEIVEPEGVISVDRIQKNVEGEQSKPTVPSGGSWKLWPFTFKRASTMNSVLPSPEKTSNSTFVDASESISNVTGDNTPQTVKVTKKKVKLLVPTSDELAALNLKDGKNVVTFTFSTAMLGKQQVDARIYLWKWNTRIVISDVDGTITKSDVLGQFMPLVGKDWSQTGVTHLFSAIKENGYQLLFLSARAISQAHLTRQFLFNLKQDGKALPDGPVVISPDGLFPSLFREVIRRAPHEFKIACLKDIKDLFPPDCNPFYAGFGNRDTDEFSYLKVGIPKGKIFIINAKGEVSVNRRVDRKSYTSLHALVNGMFPATTSAEQEEFNSWNFWKMPLPDIGS